jgi:hypothetical protein
MRVELKLQLSAERIEMPTLDELLRISPNELVALCQRVADDPAAYLLAEAEEAAKLKLEWENLQTAPSFSHALQTRIEAQKDDVRKRIIGFLAAVL